MAALLLPPGSALPVGKPATAQVVQVRRHDAGITGIVQPAWRAGAAGAGVTQERLHCYSGAR